MCSDGIDCKLVQTARTTQNILYKPEYYNLQQSDWKYAHAQHSRVHDNEKQMATVHVTLK